MFTSRLYMYDRDITGVYFEIFFLFFQISNFLLYFKERPIAMLILTKIVFLMNRLIDY